MKRVHTVAAALALTMAPAMIHPGIANADPRTGPTGQAKPIDYVIQRALSQRGVPFVYGGGDVTGPTTGARASSNARADGVNPGPGSTAGTTPDAQPGTSWTPGTAALPGATSANGVGSVPTPGPATVGFDASGLIQYAYAAAGIKMPRTSGEQCNVGRKVAPAQARPGDLMCFGPNGSQSVAMYLGNNQMIEGTEPTVTVSQARTTNMTPYLTRIIES